MLDLVENTSPNSVIKYSGNSGIAVKPSTISPKLAGVTGIEPVHTISETAALPTELYPNYSYLEQVVLAKVRVEIQPPVYGPRTLYSFRLPCPRVA